MNRLKLSEWLNYTDRQKEAHEALKDFDYVLYGGAVGGGKSYWLLKETALQLLKWGKTGLKNIQAGVFCKDYPSLEDRQIKMCEALIGDLGTLRRNPYPEFKFHDAYGGHIIMFRNLDDPSKYKSTQFALIAVDEVNENPLKSFNELRVRLRWAGISKPKFIASCNPIGEPWVEEYWIKRAFPVNMINIKDKFKFVQSLPTDNPHLPPEYFESLESLPTELKEAYLNGVWGSMDALMDEQGYIRLVTNQTMAKAQVPNWFHSGYKILGIDVGAGVDETSMVLRSDSYAEILFNQRLKDTMQIRQMVNKLLDDGLVIDYVVMDITGLGKPVFDEWVQNSMIPIKGVNFANKSNEPKRFENIKAEIFWKTKLWLENGGKVQDKPEFRQLESIKYKNFDDKKVKFQSKQDLIKSGTPSPNIADAMALTFGIENSVIIGKKEIDFYHEMMDNNGISNNIEFGVYE